VSEINLLPQEDRAREQKERVLASRVAESQRVRLTQGSLLPKAQKAARGHLLQRLFGKTPPDLGQQAVRDGVYSPPVSSVPEPPQARQKSSFLKRWLGIPKKPTVGAAISSKASEAVASPAISSAESIQREEHPQAGSFLVLSKNLLANVFQKHHRKEENSKPLVTSLLPHEYVRASYHALAYTKVIGALLVSCGIVALGFWLLLGYETVARAQFDQAKTAAATIDQEVRALDREKAEALRLQNKVDAASKLLDAHVRWTRALTFLEGKTVEDVQYESMTVDTSGKISLKALGSSFSALARQLVVFQNTPEVKFVSINKGDAADAGGGVQFDAALEVFPDVFQNKNSVIGN